MSVWICQPTTGKAAEEIVPPRSRIPWWKGLCADSGEKHAPASDPDAAKVDSLKALDPNRPIRESGHPNLWPPRQHTSSGCRSFSG